MTKEARMLKARIHHWCFVILSSLRLTHSSFCALPLRLAKAVLSEQTFLRALCLIFNLSFLIFNCYSLTPVQYNASDFTGTTNNNPVTLTSVQRLRVNNQTMLVGLPIYFTPANGSYATNIFPGLYNLTIQGVPVAVTCLVPDSTNTQDLASCVVSNMGLFTATNLTFLITNPVALLPGTNIQMTTNGFNVTISGVVTNLDGLIISNGVVYAAFAGDGSGLTNLNSTNLNGTISTNDLFGLLPALANTNGGGLTNLTAANLTGTVPIQNGGTGNVTGFAQGVTNSFGDPNSFLLTNLNSIQYLFFPGTTPADWTNYIANANLSLAVNPSAHNSGNGIFFALYGTNYNGAENIWKIYTNAQGIVETNSVQDGQAVFFGMVPKQSGTSNGTPDVGNINKGAGTIGMNGEPFSLATIWSGAENDYLYQTNGYEYGLLFQTTNYDGQQDGFAKAMWIRDHQHGIETLTNLATYTVSASNIVINGSGGITALAATAGITMPNAGATLTNLALNLPPSTTTDFVVPLNLGNGSWFIGYRKGANIQTQSLYFGDVNAVLLQMDENHGVYTYGTTPFSTISETVTNTASISNVAAGNLIVTNAPTFKTTNATPSGWTGGSGGTSPRIWIPFTNGTTAYYLPGY